MENKKLIIKALKTGVPVTRIAKELGIPLRTLWWKIENDEDLQEAKQHHLNYIDNLFS